MKKAWLAVLVSLTSCQVGPLESLELDGGSGGPTAAAVFEDAGSVDPGPFDAGSFDAGSFDAGSFDAGSFDAGSFDAGSFDAGSFDAGSFDAGSFDAGSFDAGSFDAGSFDAGSLDACVPETDAEFRAANCPVNACGSRTVRDACGALRTVDCGTTCASPPSAACADGFTRRSSESVGTCVSGVCEYAPALVGCGAASCTNGAATAAGTCSGSGVCAAGATSACSFGCSGTACAGDPCANVTCSAPPSPTCADGTTRRAYASTGTCRAVGGTATCEYAMMDVPCPPASCTNGVATAAGTCSGAGVCAAGATSTCTFGCSGTACAGDPCATETCSVPPPPTCADGTTRRTSASTGTCRAVGSTATCDFATMDTPCAAASCTNGVATAAGTCAGFGVCIAGVTSTCTWGCLWTACAPSPCVGVTCGTPPPATCANATTRRTSASLGTCSVVGGTPQCSYTTFDTACAAASCQNGVATAASTCVNGSCQAGAQTSCTFGCLGTACAPDPCTGVTCTNPPATVCENATTIRSYVSPGTCSSATQQAVCSFARTDTACPSGLVCGSGGSCVQPGSGAAPSTPSNLTATTVSSTQINLAWGASMASGTARLSGYKVEQCRDSVCTEFVTRTNTTAFNFTSLITSTSYSFRVRAYDNAGNNSNYSNVATAMTGGTTYANTTDVQLRSFNVVESLITISGRSGNAPATTRVDVNIVYPNISGLNVQLIDPSGAFRWLHNGQQGGPTTNNLDTYYSVNLSSLPMNGTWKLRVWGASRSVSYIDSWSIAF